MNYGGLLQAAALQKVLKDMGHDPYTVRKESTGYYYQRFDSLKLFFLWLMELSGLYSLRMMLQERVRKPHRILGTGFCTFFNLHMFRLRYIQQTKWIRSKLSQSVARKLNFDTYIVGSDQIWRYIYHSKNIDQSYLSFLPLEVRQRSFSYAASFGSSSWEYSANATEQCKQLLSDFQAVSVREHSGVELVRRYLGCEAEWMPDPTCLLTERDYSMLIDMSQTPRGKGSYLACYCLDETDEKKKKVEALSHSLQLPVKYLGGESDGQVQSVESWLGDIRDARCVVTDSFHGCMFSLIFGKEFVCLRNAERGNARFDTLEEMFDMKDVFHPAPDPVLPVRISEERWKFINERLAAYRERGLDFLRRNLEEAARRKENCHV